MRRRLRSKGRFTSTPVRSRSTSVKIPATVFASTSSRACVGRHPANTCISRPSHERPDSHGKAHRPKRGGVKTKSAGRGASARQYNIDGSVVFVLCAGFPQTCRAVLKQTESSNMQD